MRRFPAIAIGLVLVTFTGYATASDDQRNRGMTQQGSEQVSEATRPATANEHRAIARGVESTHKYEASTSIFGTRVKGEARRRLVARSKLTPTVVRARVSRSDPRFAAAVVELRDAAGRARRGTTAVVLRRFTDSRSLALPGGKWRTFDQTGTRFQGSCGAATARGIRDLVCPDPWSVLGYPAPKRKPDMTIEAPGPVTDIRSVDWRHTTFPGAACGFDRPVNSKQSYLKAASNPSVDMPWWVIIDGGGAEPAAYGDLDGDGQDEAVLLGNCTNNGGMAAGQLFFYADVVGVEEGGLKLLGVIHPRQPISPQTTHVPLLFFRADAVRPGHVIAHEAWYGPCDGTACGTGQAVTDWRYERGRLVPVTRQLFPPIQPPCFPPRRERYSAARWRQQITRSHVPAWLLRIADMVRVPGWILPTAGDSD
jgi:hypothetical protein